MRGLGWAARAHRLPDPGEERHVAGVVLRPRAASSTDRDLLDALRRRRTDRRRFTSWPVPAERLNALASVGSGWGAQVLPVPGEVTKDHLRRLTRQAARVQQLNERYVAELAAWTDGSPAEGIPADHRPARGGADPDEAVHRRFPAARRPAGRLGR